MDAVTGSIYRKRERMSRYIDADELKKEVEYSMERNPHEIGNLRSNHRVEHKHFIRIICSQPTADVEPVRHAHWKAQEYEFLTCSKCGESYYTGYDCTPDAKEKLENGDCYNYCPHCGAKMDESVKQ